MTSIRQSETLFRFSGRVRVRVRVRAGVSVNTFSIKCSGSESFPKGVAKHLGPL